MSDKGRSPTRLLSLSPKPMSNQGRMALLALVMAGLAVVLAVGSFAGLYSAAFDEQRNHLRTLASTEKNLIEAVASFDRVHSGGEHQKRAVAATLSQVDMALRNAEIAINEDILLATRVGDEIHYQSRSRGHERALPKPIKFGTEGDQAMYLALIGKTGIIRAFGSDKVEYLEAYTDIPSLNAGLVTRVAIAEIQRPFINAGILTTGGILFVIFLSIFLFRKISVPLIERLEQTARHLEEGQRIAKYGSWRRDLVAGRMEWSEQIYTMLGCQPDVVEPSAEAFLERIHKDDRTHVQKILRDAQHTLEPYFTEYRIVLPDGSVRYMEGQGEISKVVDGAAVSMRGIINDVTTRKLAELSIVELNESLEQRVETRTRALKIALAEHQQTQELLQDSEARTRAIVDTAADGIVAINGEGLISSFNGAAEHIFGWSAADVIGKNISQLMPKSDAVHHDGYLTRFIDTQEPVIIGVSRELRGLKKDGSEFPMELAVSASDIGGRQMFTGIIRDISERKAFERELAVKEGQLRETLDNMPGAIAFIDANAKVVFASNTFHKLCEVPEDYLKQGSDFAAYFRYTAERGDYGPADPDKMDQMMALRLASLTSTANKDIEIPRPSGRITGIQGRVTEDGGIVIVISDITERKKFEIELALKEERLRVTMDNMPGGIAFIDENAKVGIASRHFHELCEVPEEYLKPGADFATYFRYTAERGDYGPIDPSKMDQMMVKRMAGLSSPTDTDIEIPRPSGRITGIQRRTTEGGGTVVVVSDITERKKIETELALKEERLREAMDNMPGGIAFIDANAKVAVASRNFHELCEVPIEFLKPGTDFAEFFLYTAERGDYGPVEPDKMDEMVALRVTGLSNPTDKDFEIVRPSGQITGAQRAITEDGGTVIVVSDITERKKIETELALKEKRLREAMDNMPGAMVFMDEHLKIIVASSRFAEISEVPTELLDEGRSILDHLMCRAERGDYGPGDPSEIIASRVKAFATPTDNVFELPTPSGRINGVQRRPADGGGLVIVLGDITEIKAKEQELHETLDTLKNTQDSLVQAEKMASLGGLVAGVAHEINTPVGISVTAASHLTDQSEILALKFDAGEMKKSELREYVETATQSTKMISANLKRAAELIGSFKQVAVDQSSEEQRRFRVSPYLEEILMSLQPQLKKTNHNVVIHCGPELEMDSYPGAFSQIITNLFMNSLIHGYTDEDSGRIAIDVTELTSEIQIVYSDDGCGMDALTRSKIFDPFFTTNRSHGGSGLGMNIVYNLVNQSLQGTVTCTSEPGQGTTFTMVFPKRLVG